MVTKDEARAGISEADVQQSIKDLAEALGFFVSDFSQGRKTRQTKGIADLYMVHGPRKFRVWVECKRPGGERSIDQVLWHAHILAAGGRVWTCDSLEAFADQLNRHGWEIEL